MSNHSAFFLQQNTMEVALACSAPVSSPPSRHQHSVAHRHDALLVTEPTAS